MKKINPLDIEKGSEKLKELKTRMEIRTLSNPYVKIQEGILDLENIYKKVCKQNKKNI